MDAVFNQTGPIFQNAVDAANNTSNLLGQALTDAGLAVGQVFSADAMDVIAAARARTVPAERAQMLASGRVPLWVACLENPNLQLWLQGKEVIRSASEKARSRVMKFVAGRGKARAPRKFRSSKQMASAFYKRPFRAFTARAGYRRKAKRTFRRSFSRSRR